MRRRSRGGGTLSAVEQQSGEASALHASAAAARAPASDRRLTANVVWNLLGEAAPFAIGIFAIPLLIRTLGLARFGVLTMLWSVITYFGVMDMGLGRALTKLIADDRARGERRDTAGLFWTGMGLLLAAGVIGAALVAGGLFLVHERQLGIAPELRREAFGAGYLLAAGFPIVVSSAGLRGTLAALQRFDLINLIELPAGALVFLAPVAVLPFSHSLMAITLALLAVRAVSWLGALYFCLAALPELVSGRGFTRRLVGPLTSFGGWVMVSNVVGPLMIFSDRFVIALMLSASLVAFYTTPFEMLYRISIIPSAITAVLFPALAESAILSPQRSAQLFEKGTRAILYLVFPLVLITTVFAERGLRLWLGADFAAHSASVARWLALAMFVNAAAWMAFASVQAMHRPDLTAKLHLVELPIYFAVLIALVARFGTLGAALAWMARVLADGLALLWIASQITPALRSAAGVILRLTALGAIALGAAQLLPEHFFVQCAYTVSCLGLLTVAAAPEVGWLCRQLRARVASAGFPEAERA